MKQVLRRGLKDIVVDEVPEPKVAPHQVLVRASRSLISAGTETASIHQDSLMKEVADNPDHLKKVLAVMAQQGPIRTIEEVSAKFSEYAVLGYSGAGVVAAAHSTVTDLAIGARVAYGGEGTGHGELVVTGRQLVAPIPDAVSDVNRAVRYIQTNAARWNVDPDRLGIVGGSAGGHLSLCIGLNPEKPDPDSNPKSKDPVDRASGRVRAVAAWFPPTDFLNYGEPGKNALGRGVLDPFYGAFEFREIDPRLKRPVIVADEKRREEIGRAISPAYHVDSDDPPVLLIHGDKDVLVPLQQSKLLEEKLKEAGVEVKLVVRPGKGHGWPDIKPDTIEIADWFDAHLLHAGPATRPAASRPAATTHSAR